MKDMTEFKPGDKVRVVEEAGVLKMHDIHRVSHITDGYVYTNRAGGGYHPERFELVQDQPTLPNKEVDPTGKSPHAPGAKLDAGKVQPRLIIEGMARAIWAVAEVATFGAIKYTPGGWVEVDNGQDRYADAGYRHVLKRAMGETVDPDSELAHLAHEAWNALAKLDLYIRSKEQA
jgi:hypothetical protein